MEVRREGGREKFYEEPSRAENAVFMAALKHIDPVCFSDDPCT